MHYVYVYAQKYATLNVSPEVLMCYMQPSFLHALQLRVCHLIHTTASRPTT